MNNSQYTHRSRYTELMIFMRSYDPVLSLLTTTKQIHTPQPQYLHTIPTPMWTKKYNPHLKDLVDFKLDTTTPEIQGSAHTYVYKQLEPSTPSLPHSLTVYMYVRITIINAIPLHTYAKCLWGNFDCYLQVSRNINEGPG